VNAATGVASTANLGSSQSVSGLSSTIAGTGVATLNITAGTTLTVNQSTDTTFAGTIINSGALAKSAGGTLEIDAAPVLVANSTLQVNGGTLRFQVASGSPTIASGVTASIAAGATLELAGTVPALASGPNRVDVLNNSQATVGGLLASSSSQQVGAIDGSGNTAVAADASLTANHIIQNALIIGGAAAHQATMIIAASDSSGNSLAGAAINLSHTCGYLLTTDSTNAECSNRPTALIDAPGAVSIPADTIAAVPEPSGLLLATCGLAFIIVVLCRKLARASAK
ncbi:MAG TPA: hypothetical protein VKB78_04960, partial [Pirellulales bacterium]|nr:hypothetical protein [Pirellulales bacterium]